MAGGHIYVDESTQGKYLLICSFVASANANDLRKTLRGLLLKGQRSIHMKAEKPHRKCQILDVIAATSPEVVVYIADGRRSGGQHAARAACLAEVAREAMGRAAQRLVLDRNESTQRHDQRTIAHAARDLGLPKPPFDYYHQPRHEEPLLWVPDAVGWAWAKGGTWRARVSPFVRSIEL
ncbi:hypothetical protein [Intrasporangium calvum]|uniref:hypothetical protein n=1 Tax=Intrasporangium calvum TaxID=53358 RepID=UPI000DF5CEE9|nr:hypothetical protein [Intrasporangium calvum]AXG12282.1 hypothetical protein DN585_01475 [Intrasporangium calvum]